MKTHAFTLLEALVVIAILALVLALVAGAWRRAKRTAQVVADSAAIRQKLDDAVIRGAIRSHKQHDEWRKQFDRMLQSGLKQ